MGDIPVYLQFVLVAFSIVGNLASTVLAGLWLVAYRRRRDEIGILQGQLDKHRGYLISSGAMPPDA